MGEVLDLAREAVRQPREAPHPHPHRQVLALDVAGRDSVGIWIALERNLLRPGADRRAVFAQLANRGIGLVDLRSVNVVPEGRPDRRFVHLVPVRR